jgi:hypothetical protein
MMGKLSDDRASITSSTCTYQMGPRCTKCTYRIGFDNFSRQQQFRTYVNYVILPSYELHQDMGLLQYTMSGEKLPEIMPFRNFLSGRLLWDEAMATNAIEWTRKNPGGLIVGLVGADHGTFSSK